MYNKYIMTILQKSLQASSDVSVPNSLSKNALNMKCGQCWTFSLSISWVWSLNLNSRITYL